MAIRYSVIKRKNLGKDKTEHPQKYYAQGVNVAQISFETVCEEAAEASAMTTADMKAAVDRLTLIVSRYLKMGYSVKIGELGCIRMAIGSTGCARRRSTAPPWAARWRLTCAPSTWKPACAAPALN